MSIYLSDTDLEDIDGEADRIGMSRSEYLRSCHRERKFAHKLTPNSLRELANYMESKGVEI